MRGKPLGLLLVFACLALASGCSAVRLTYNNADFLIERYADGYFGLERSQLADWSGPLEKALVRHRASELPHLAAFFDSAQRAIRVGLTRPGVACLLDQFEALAERHLQLAVEAVAPLLVELDAAQIDQLADTFATEAREDAAQPGAAESQRRARKRAKRYEKNLRWWVGRLNEPQRQIIREVTVAMPDTAPAWQRYRTAKRDALIALLRRGSGESGIKDFLNAWLVDRADLPAGLRAAPAALRAGFSELLLRLEPTFSAEQRQQLLGRLEQLRDDFLTLQPQPHLAPVSCIDAAAPLDALP